MYLLQNILGIAFYESTEQRGIPQIYNDLILKGKKESKNKDIFENFA